jgi:Flp pilus assembly protein TadG
MKIKRALPMLPALARDEDGNTGMLFGLMAIPMLSLVGAAIDYSTVVRDQSILQNTLDAASIAAVTEYQANHNATTANTRLTSYIQEGLANTGMSLVTGNSVANGPGQVTVTNTAINTSNGSVSPSATVSIATNLLKLIGLNSITVSANSSAGVSQSGQQLEVGMMIDLTGSMGQTRNGQAKIDGLKAAGQDLLNILFPNGDNPNVRVGIAPMADYVNAGSYAAVVTGQAATGTYASGTNLSSTMQGQYFGTYTGVGGGGSGQGFGATNPQSTQGGNTYSNGFCSNPYTNATNGDPNGVPTNGNGWGWGYGNSSQRSAQWGSYWPVDSNGNPIMWNNAVWGWINQTQNQQYLAQYPQYTQYFQWNYQENWGWYIQSSTAGCSQVAQPTGQLISCVTERTQTHTNPYDGHTDQYDDADPTLVPVGGYNTNTGHGQYAYSSDGKCYVAGRELPTIIPLTSSKSTLQNFFTSATVGGGTPGHIGTAWAWYLISPNWVSVWPTASDPKPYNTPNNKKAVIIMTDGEYNEQYSSVDSRTQALALCSKMKAAGVTVYTVGFGFSSSNNSDSAALTLLQQCATSSATTFVPYDGTALRAAFSNIAQQLMTTNAKIVISH